MAGWLCADSRVRERGSGIRVGPWVGTTAVVADRAAAALVGKAPLRTPTQDAERSGGYHWMVSSLRRPWPRRL
jgi:hypothetical protein